MCGEFPKASARVLARLVQGETLLYHRERRTVHVLNAPAGAVWRGCDGTRSIRSLAQELRDSCGADAEVPLEEVESDVREIVGQLAELDLLEREAPGRRTVE